MQFLDIKKQARLFCADIISRQVILKKEAKDLQDEEFRRLVENHLEMVGLELIDNIYADYYAIAVKKEYELILEDQKSGEYHSNNQQMNKGSMALLTILWALLILPKRERQTADIERIPSQINFIRSEKRPIPKGIEVYVQEETFRLEYGHIFGKRNKSRFSECLNELVRLNLIKRKTMKSKFNDEMETRLIEGPLLDTLIDYKEMIENIKDGLLVDLPKLLEKTESLKFEEAETEQVSLDDLEKNLLETDQVESHQEKSED
jgi:hypothetical protein